MSQSTLILAGVAVAGVLGVALSQSKRKAEVEVEAAPPPSKKPNVQVTPVAPVAPVATPKPKPKPKPKPDPKLLSGPAPTPAPPPGFAPLWKPTPYVPVKKKREPVLTHSKGTSTDWVDTADMGTSMGTSMNTVTSVVGRGARREEEEEEARSEADSVSEAGTVMEIAENERTLRGLLEDMRDFLNAETIDDLPPGSTYMTYNKVKKRQAKDINYNLSRDHYLALLGINATWDDVADELTVREYPDPDTMYRFVDTSMPYMLRVFDKRGVGEERIKKHYIFMYNTHNLLRILTRSYDEYSDWIRGAAHQTFVQRWNFKMDTDFDGLEDKYNDLRAMLIEDGTVATVDYLQYVTGSPTAYLSAEELTIGEFATPEKLNYFMERNAEAIVEASIVASE